MGEPNKQATIALMPGEVAQLLRHRSLMAFYLSGIIALIWLNWDQRVPGLPLELHAPPQIGAVLAGVWCALRIGLGFALA